MFDRHAGRKGRLSLQTNPALYGNADGMLAQGERFHRLAPNIQVKFPTTAAGLVRSRRATARGVAINSTVAFTVSQALAVGEAVERGLRRFEDAGGDPSRSRPVCSLMVGRLDDWVKVLVERDDIALDPAAAATGRGSPRSSGRTGSTRSAATGRGSWPPRSATASTGRSSSAATSS